MRSAWIPPVEPVSPIEGMPPGPPSQRIKVLHVITKFTTGAGGNTLLSATGMDPSVYEVWIAASAGGELWERAERCGVRTVILRRFRETISPLNDLLVLWQLVRLIRRERFTIVHTHTAKGGFLGRIAARMCHTPVVVHTIHAFSFHRNMGRLRHRLYLTLERIARRPTHAFIAVAPHVAAEAVERRVAPPGKITVVPSAVDLDDVPHALDAQGRLQIGVPAGVPLIGTVGRISGQKAPLDFVRMAAIIARTVPDARFAMVGDGPMIDDVRREAERAGVEIILPGFREDALKIAAGFDVFVMPSLYEGLGRSLTEALAAGRPVVATAVNGVLDLVIHGATGLLTAPGDPEALARSVLWLLDHPDEAEDMGSQGRTVVRDLFRQAGMCESLNEIYCELLGLPPEESSDHEANVIVLPDAPVRSVSGRGR
jgi:glycosyltransferase involved in cell wall biosynthesis